METKKDINNIVSAARARLGMTQRDFGAAIGRSERLIYKIEAGQCGLSRQVEEAVRRLLIDRGITAADPYSDAEVDIIRQYRLLPEESKSHVAAIIRGLAGAPTTPP